MEYEPKRFIGIDLSKRTYEAVAILAETHAIIRWNGKLDLHGREALLGKLASGDIVALEAGTASFKIAKELQEKEGVTVVVLNAANLAIIYASLKKTDKEDALKLAKLLQKYSLEELPAVPLPTDEEMEHRAFVAHETRFRQDRVRLINRQHAVFLRSGFPDHTKRQLGIRSTREKFILEELEDFSLVEAMNLHRMINEYEAMLKRGKAKSVAIVALARKLLEMVYILLTRRERYRYIDPCLYTTKLRRVGFNSVGAGIC